MSEQHDIRPDELDIRNWFMHAELSEAIATHNIVEGILSMRQLQQPARKRRKDADRLRKPKKDQPLFREDLTKGVPT